MREKRKPTEAQNRVQQRKQDLDQRKREEEKLRIREEQKMDRSQPFSKKDAVEFEKALVNFGLELKEDGTIDWVRFKSLWVSV